jgi:hypothetical protein
LPRLASNWAPPYPNLRIQVWGSVPGPYGVFLFKHPDPQSCLCAWCPIIQVMKCAVGKKPLMNLAVHSFLVFYSLIYGLYTISLFIFKPIL